MPCYREIILFKKRVAVYERCCSASTNNLQHKFTVAYHIAHPLRLTLQSIASNCNRLLAIKHGTHSKQAASTKIALMFQTTPSNTTAAHSRPYDLLIFDWDGTLMDSTSTIAACIQAACVAVGEPEPPLELAKHVIGLGLQDALQLCAPNCPADKYPALAMHYRDHFLQQDRYLTLFDGVIEMFTTFKAQGYTLAVATGKNRRGLDRVLAQSSLGHWFATTRTADETESKPSPKMVLEILAQLHTPAHRALVIGDTTHDLLMAASAGVAAFAVTQGAHEADKLATAKPAHIASRIDELPQWLASRTASTA
jgi:phosphoglycolate phosphatase